MSNQDELFDKKTRLAVNKRKMIHSKKIIIIYMGRNYCDNKCLLSQEWFFLYIVCQKNILNEASIKKNKSNYDVILKVRAFKNRIDLVINTETLCVPIRFNY
jgi:hypothetical protein